MVGKKLLGINEAKRSVVMMGTLFLGLIVVFMAQGAMGATTTVGPAGSGADYTTIQDAINASSDGDTIRIWDGTYTENVIVNKSVTIEANSSVVLDGQGNNGTKITVSNVTIQNLSIINCNNSMNTAGVYIYNSSNTLNNVTLDNITVNNSTGGVFGIDMTANITQCNFSCNHTVFGMYLMNSNICNISHNEINNTMLAMYLDNSSHNTIYENNICNNTHGGIYSYNSTSNNICNNTFWNFG
ncbi:MAG: right-handed parallel beta-helix repeat-containing protein, partial [Candidatus Thermoplasmatota archaeon]|nr:right-handed parallel beta-helix repeat-containing protein [Candidatus Thermoplasmatota archaeon]